MNHTRRKQYTMKHWTIGNDLCFRQVGKNFVTLAMEANRLLMSLILEAISHYLTWKNQYSLHKKLWSTNQRESIYNLWGWLVFTKWRVSIRTASNQRMKVPQRNFIVSFSPEFDVVATTTLSEILKGPHQRTSRKLPTIEALAWEIDLVRVT